MDHPHARGPRRRQRDLDPCVHPGRAANPGGGGFFRARREPRRAPELGAYYRDLYARLYDEDESMMTGRQAQLDTIRERREAAENETRRVLGSLDDVRSRLPMAVEAGGRWFRVIEVD